MLYVIDDLANILLAVSEKKKSLYFKIENIFKNYLY